MQSCDGRDALRQALGREISRVLMNYLTDPDKRHNSLVLYDLGIVVCRLEGSWQGADKLNNAQIYGATPLYSNDRFDIVFDRPAMRIRYINKVIKTA